MYSRSFQFLKPSGEKEKSISLKQSLQYCSFNLRLLLIFLFSAFLFVNSNGKWLEENAPVANAGADQDLCDMLSANLGAIPSTGTGSWSYVSGPDGNPMFTDINSPWSLVMVNFWGTYIFRWTETDGTSTSSDEVTINFTERPQGYASPEHQIICSDQDMVFIMLSTFDWDPEIAFTWTRDNTENVWGMPEIGSGDIFGFLMNWTPVDQVTIFTITPINSSGCIGDPFTAEVIVKGVPEGFSMPSYQDVCSEEWMMDILLTTFNGMDGNTTFTWTRDNTVNVVGLEHNGSSSNISGSPVNLTDVVQTVTYNIVPVSIEGCIGNHFQAVLRVSPKPVGEAFPFSQQVCSDETMQDIQLSTINGMDAGMTYEWTCNPSPDVTGLFTFGTGDIIHGVPTNHSDITQVVTYTITPTSANGCRGEPFTAELIVHPKPIGIASPAAQLVCSNEEMEEIVLSTSFGWDPGISYDWTSDNSMNVGGLANIGSGNISGTLINYTLGTQFVTFTIIPTGPDGCMGDPFTATVTVNPIPAIHLDVSDSILCNGGTTSLSITNLNTGINGTWLYDLEVIADPEISGEINNQTGISKISFSETLSNYDTIAHKVAYNFRPRIIPDDGGADCNNGSISSVVIWVNPTPRIRTHADSVICNGETVIFLCQNPNTSIPGSWHYDLVVDADPEITGTLANQTGSTATSFTQTLNNSDTIVHKVAYHFVPRIAPNDGGLDCENGRDTTLVIWVNPTPDIQVDVPDTIICDNSNVEINVSTDLGPVMGGILVYDLVVSYNASYVSGSITANGEWLSIQSISDLLINNTNTVQQVTYNFTARIRDNRPGHSGYYCENGRDTTIVIWVNPTPHIQADVPDTIICDNSNVEINVSTDLGPVMGGTLVYDLDVSYNALYVSGSITANGEWLSNQSISDLLINDSNTVQQVTYNFTARIMDDRPGHSGYYCDNGSDTAINIWVNPTAHVYDPPDQVLNSDENTSEILFSTKNSGGTVTYSWTNDTPSIGLASSGMGNIGSFEAINTGTIPVVATITVTPGFSTFGEICTGPGEQFSITVHPKVPDADAGPDQNHCGLLSTYMEGNDPNTATGTWSQFSGPGTMAFGDVNSNNTSATATLYGTYVLRWTITSSGEPTQDELTITFMENPQQASAGTDQELCGILSTSLEATSHTYQAGSDFSGSSKQWIYVSGSDSNPLFSDAGSPSSNVTVDAYGTYVFRWTETNGSCTRADELTINFYENPAVDAGADQEICSGDSLTLTAIGEGSISWDQGISNGVPFVPGATTYYQAIATDDKGCSNQDQVLVTVKPIPQTPTIEFISDTLVSDSDLGHQWYVDEVPIPDAEGSFYVPANSGTYYAMVSDAACISGKSNAIYVQISNLKQLDDYKINIYPNPTEDIIRIETGDLGRYILEITSASGQIMLQQVVSDPIYSVNLSPFSYGTYFITIKNQEYSTTRKVVKL